MDRKRHHSPFRSRGRSAEPNDLYDYARPPPCRAQPRRVDQAEPAAIMVTDDWPDIVPVTEAELRVMEAHFADLLDEIFGPKA